MRNAREQLLLAFFFSSSSSAALSWSEFEYINIEMLAYIRGNIWQRTILTQTHNRTHLILEVYFFAVSFAREWHNMKWLINIYAFLLHAHWTPIRFYYATGKYYYILHATRKKFCDFFFFRWNCFSRMANFRCNTKSRERVCYAINNTWFIYFFHFWPFRSNFTNAC